MENANMNFPRSCKCSSFAYSRYPLFFRKTTNNVISAIPATKVDAKVYQLYMVEYQCALMLMSHNQGIEDNTDNANNTIKMAAHTVLVQMKRLPSATVNGAASMERESWRIL